MATKGKIFLIYGEHGGRAPAVTSAAFAADGRVTMSSFYIPERCTLRALNWIAGAAVTDPVRVGIYNAVESGDGITPVGGALLYDSGDLTMSGANAAQRHILTTPLTIERGWYYFALQGDTGSAFMRHGNQGQNAATFVGAFFDNTSGITPLPNPCPAVTSSSSSIPGCTMECILDEEDTVYGRRRGLHSSS